MNVLKRCPVMVACLLGLVLSGCGVDSTGVVGGGNPVSVSAKQTGADVCLVGPGGIEVVYRHDLGIDSARALGQPDDSGGDGDPLTTIIDLLVSGPTEAERARGLVTEVADDMRLVIKDREALVNALNSVPLDGVELAQPLAVTVVSWFQPTAMAAEQIGCTLERYLARSGIVAQVILHSAGDELVPRPGIEVVEG